MKQIIVHSIEETNRLGQKLAHFVRPGMLITLSGDLGAGKTTFTKSIGKHLGVQKTMNSPTFTILKIYQGKLPIYHIDAYRLEGISQDLGFEEYFEDHGLCIIEWPAFIKQQLPEERLEITITRRSEEQEERLFTFTSCGAKYEEIVEAM